MTASCNTAFGTRRRFFEFTPDLEFVEELYEQAKQRILEIKNSGLDYSNLDYENVYKVSSIKVLNCEDAAEKW